MIRDNHKDDSCIIFINDEVVIGECHLGMKVKFTSLYRMLELVTFSLPGYRRLQTTYGLHGRQRPFVKCAA